MGFRLSLCLAEAWKESGKPDPFILCEPGPGRGTLMQDALRATAKIHGLKRIPASIREVLIRVVAEGVTNVILHSGATRVHIEVQRHDAVGGRLPLREQAARRIVFRRH